MGSTSPSAAPAAHISELTGPLVIGVTFNVFLLGVLTMQTCLYYLAFPDDLRKIKIIVCTVYILEALQAILFVVTAKHKLAAGFVNPADLPLVDTWWLSVPVLTGLITVLCQGWYAHRIWSLAKNISNTAMKAVFFVIVVICIVHLTVSIIIGISLKNAGRLDVYYADTHTYKSVSSMWCASSALGDVLIAICMVLFFVQFTGTEYVFPATKFLEKIVRLIVGTNAVTGTLLNRTVTVPNVHHLTNLLRLPTAACSVAILAMVWKPISPGHHQAILAIIAKLYSNSMMVQLNTRMRISVDIDESNTWQQSAGVWSAQCRDESEMRFQRSETGTESS